MYLVKYLASFSLCLDQYGTLALLVDHEIWLRSLNHCCVIRATVQYEAQTSSALLNTKAHPIQLIF